MIANLLSRRGSLFWRRSQIIINVRCPPSLLSLFKQWSFIFYHYSSKNMEHRFAHQTVWHDRQIPRRETLFKRFSQSVLASQADNSQWFINLQYTSLKWISWHLFLLICCKHSVSQSLWSYKTSRNLFMIMMFPQTRDDHDIFCFQYYLFQKLFESTRAWKTIYL